MAVLLALAVAFLVGSLARDPTPLRAVAAQSAESPILRTMQTPEPMVPPRSPDPVEGRPAPRAAAPGYWGERLAWVAGLVLAISAFTDWYAGSQADGLTLSVTGWHTGALGKLVFFAGLATLILEALREAGNRAARNGAREPRADRARIARDDLRA